MGTQNQTALESTAPRTPEGKHVVVLKPIRHGLRARTVVLPAENRQEFHQLCDDLEAEWNPRSRTEQFYLEQMAVNQWKLTRLEVGEINTFKKDGDNIRLLDRLWQAQCRMERSYARAQRELERLQATRRNQPRLFAEIPTVAVASAEVTPARKPGDYTSLTGVAAGVYPQIFFGADMDLHKEIAALSDVEAERCLNVLVKQIADANPGLQEILSSPTLAAEAVQSVGAQTGAGAIKEAEIKDRPAAIRAILQEAAKDPALAPRLEAWLSGPRKMLFEPITTTLILAGVVIALSTHVKIEYENKDGKKHLKVTVEKKASSESIIKKVLSFAGFGGKK